jgi:guanosine-3',5'-bis(diphosphate) 3'-pyrophosphohydrolase
MISLENYFLSINALRDSEFSSSDLLLISKAFELGKKYHEGQVRANGLGYFEEHCIPVSYHVASLGMDSEMVAAALLHDTLEDTKLTMKELILVCGADIASMVDGVSKLSKVKYRGNERHVESLRKFFVAVAKDARVVILKLCDRWHNLETLDYLPEEKRARIARESILIHAQLASRLNMGNLANTLKDLAFPYAYPDEYAKTTKALDGALDKANRTAQLMHLRLAMVSKEALGYEATIDERVKGLYSTYQKLERKQWNMNLIYDLVALRVIVRNVDDCYRMLGAIHGTWHPMPSRLKDYIALPKPNSYKSLHTVVMDSSGVNAEVQIRTQEMHLNNEYGITAHHAYKTRSAGDGNSFDWIDQLSSLKDKGLSPDEYIHELKSDFFETRIFALTPGGDVIDLPEGATVLDFAFAVHSDIGEHAKSAIINGLVSDIFSRIESESVIEIITSLDSLPSTEWLTNVTTSHAKNRINRSLSQMEIEGR